MSIPPKVVRKAWEIPDVLSRVVSYDKEIETFPCPLIPPMTDTATQPAHGTLSNEQVDKLLADRRVCAVFMKLIAEALERCEKEHMIQEISEKPIRDEGATLLKT